jgi:hypothetical protein
MAVKTWWRFRTERLAGTLLFPNNASDQVRNEMRLQLRETLQCR